MSFVVSVQLLLWTISGIYFAFNQIELVRGEQYRQTNTISVDFSEIGFKIPEANSIRFIERLNQIGLVLRRGDDTDYLDMSGKPLSKLSIEEAKSIVSLSTLLNPLSAKEITNSEPGAEYRGRHLPLFKVRSTNDENEEINVYVDSFSGEIVAIRSAQWRIWDLMWGFHIMDWEERDDFNHWLLKLFSILALVSSITGLLLFFKLDLN